MLVISSDAAGHKAAEARLCYNPAGQALVYSYLCWGPEAKRLPDLSAVVEVGYLGAITTPDGAYRYLGVPPPTLRLGLEPTGQGWDPQAPAKACVQHGDRDALLSKQTPDEQEDKQAAVAVRLVNPSSGPGIECIFKYQGFALDPALAVPEYYSFADLPTWPLELLLSMAWLDMAHLKARQPWEDGMEQYLPAILLELSRREMPVMYEWGGPLQVSPLFEQL
jgi:hypothetical protein